MCHIHVESFCGSDPNAEQLFRRIDGELQEWSTSVAYITSIGVMICSVIMRTEVEPLRFVRDAHLRFLNTKGQDLYDDFVWLAFPAGRSARFCWPDAYTKPNWR